MNPRRRCDVVGVANRPDVHEPCVPVPFERPDIDSAQLHVPPLRIALVASSAYPSLGGVEHHVRSVARELHRRGHAVEVWTVARDGAPTRATVDGIPVRHLPAPLPAMSVRSIRDFAFAVPSAWKSWTSAYRRFRPQMLHVHCFGPNGVYALALSRRFRVPLGVSSHGETFMDEDAVFDRSVLLRAALRSSVSRADFVTGCSEYVLRDLRARFGLRRGEVAFNGIELEGAPSAQREGSGSLVLAIGRLVRVKGMDLLLRAFASASLAEGSRLVIGGDGAERASLERLSEELGISEKVEFLGRLDDAGVMNAMASASALVVPSRVEAFGIVVLEGWRAGLPVIVTERGGPSEFVTHLYDGYLTRPEDVVSLRVALERVLGDPELSARLAGAGLQRVGDFTWGATTDIYERLYGETTSRQASLRG